MPKGVLGTVLACCALLPAIGMAQPSSKPQPQLSYTYVELSYDESDFDVAGARNVDGDGFTLAGSFRINDDWHAVASYGKDDLDFGINLRTWEIGAGYRYPVRDNVDLYGRVLYIRRNGNWSNVIITARPKSPVPRVPAKRLWRPCLNRAITKPRIWW